MATFVELRAAKIPWIGWLAVHYWYVVLEDQQTTRWEVWQRAGLSPESWGHLHKNLMPCNAGVGNGGSWCEYTWTGEFATQLAQILTASPETYPYCDRYCYFPGPNSNTYVQWVLQQAGNPHRLSRKGIGKGFKLPIDQHFLID